jgi:hypothetical protein
LTASLLPACTRASWDFAGLACDRSHLAGEIV